MTNREIKKRVTEKVLKAMALMDDVWWAMEDVNDIKAQKRAETIRRKMYELVTMLDERQD